MQEHHLCLHDASRIWVGLCEKEIKSAERSRLSCIYINYGGTSPEMNFVYLFIMKAEKNKWTLKKGTSVGQSGESKYSILGQDLQVDLNPECSFGSHQIGLIQPVEAHGSAHSEPGSV